MAEFTLEIGKLNNRRDPIKLGQVDFRNPVIQTLTQAVNVDLDAVGGIASVRPGRTERLAGAPHSFWSNPFDETVAYFVEASILKKFNTDHTATTVATLGANLRASFENINDEIVVTNGVNIGWVKDTTYDEFAPTLGQFERKMPAGQYLGIYNGTLYVADGSTIKASKPWNIERTDERYDTFPMNGYIRMLGAVENGLWVATDREVAFIQGGGPDEFGYTQVTDNIPPDGAFSVDYEETADGSSRVVRWVSKEGFCEGRAGGSFRNLSIEDVALPTGTSGVCFHRDNNGTKQTVAVIRNPEGAESFTPPTITKNSITVS